MKTGRLGRRESVFKLPLPTTVEGQDSTEKTFKEKTVLYYINHQGATFELSTPLTIGTRLKLIINLPPALAEDKNLKLVINGHVTAVEKKEPASKKQWVSLRLENKYFIKADG